jgi:hypothetical protein
MARLRHNTNIVTGTLNGVSNASVTGNSVFLGTNNQKISDLSAHLIVTAATSALTVKPYWQVSNDNSTWIEAFQNELNSPIGSVLPIATGAENVTCAVQAPQVVYSYRYTRCLLAVGGATGAAGDLFSAGYSYRMH